MTFGQVLLTWQFYASVLLVGGILGKVLYRYTPLPAGARGHAEMLARAGVASRFAQSVGDDSLESLANQVGAEQLLTIFALLTKQRRQLLFVGIAIAAVALLLAFMYLPVMQLIPFWIYIVAALVGAFIVYKAW